MRTTQCTRPAFDTTWYFPATRMAREAELRVETERLLSMVDLGHVYVVEFVSGVVKVGKSVDPAGRIATHALLARAHGGGVRASWVSRAHYCCGRTERELIEFCSRAGRPAAGREYFHIPFGDACQRASLLAANRVAPCDLDDPWADAQRRLDAEEQQ